MTSPDTRSLALALVALLGALSPALATPDEASRPATDPFVILVEKPKPPPPPVPDRTKVVLPTLPRKPPPVIVKLLTLVTAGKETLALVSYKGEEYVVGSGWNGADEEGFDRAFRVVSVGRDELVLYDSGREERKTVRP